MLLILQRARGANKSGGKRRIIEKLAELPAVHGDAVLRLDCRIGPIILNYGREHGLRVATRKRCLLQLECGRRKAECRIQIVRNGLISTVLQHAVGVGERPAVHLLRHVVGGAQIQMVQVGGQRAGTAVVVNFAAIENRMANAEIENLVVVAAASAALKLGIFETPFLST